MLSYSGDGANRDVVNSGYGCQRFPIATFISNFNHLVVSKFSLWVFLTFVRIVLLSSFIYHVLYIFIMSCKEQVIRIATASIVAFVTHTQSIWYGAIGQFPSNSMRSICVLLRVNNPVSFFGFVCPPIPTLAGIAYIYMFPELLRNGLCYSVVVPVYKAFWLAFNLTRTFIIVRINTRWLSTTTFTQVDLFWEGICDRIGHVEPPCRLNHAPGRLPVAGAFCTL